MTEEKKLTGFPSMDKLWLTHYVSGHKDLSSANTSMYEFFYERNKGFEYRTALNYFGNTIKYTI